MKPAPIHLLALQDRTHSAIQSFMRARDAISGKDANGEVMTSGWMDAGVISLAHGEGVRRPHHTVVAAGIRALLDTQESSLDNYLYLKPFPDFESELTSGFIADGVPEDVAANLCIDSGNTRLFLGFFHAVGDPGDVFLVPRGYYQAVNMWADISSVYLEPVRTRREDDYKFSRDALERFYRDRVETGEVRPPKGLILFSPSYTGAVYSSEELQDIAEFMEEHDLVALEDAIFRSTEFSGQPSPYLSSIPAAAQRVVTINGGSKAYGLANLRIGWGCGAQWIIEAMRYYSMATSITVPHIAKAMALAALRAPASYLEGNIKELSARAQLVSELIDEINAQVETALGFSPVTPLIEVAHQPQAAHSTLVSCAGMAGLRTSSKEIIRDSADITRHFLQGAKVCLSPAVSNGFEDCTLRIAFGCLGWEQTYNYPQRDEQIASAYSVLEQYFPDQTHDDLTERLRKTGISPTLTSFDDVNPGFEGGRQELTEAVGVRLGSAIVRLALANRDLLAERVVRRDDELAIDVVRP